MRPAPFDYIAAATLDEALATRAKYGGDSAVLAGGQSLVPALNLRLARPRVVLDVNGVAELAGIRSENGELVVGALTRQRAAERSELVASACPLLAEALVHVGHPSIRSRGTIGGSLAHADPAAELPAVAAAVDARLVLRRAESERTVAAADFFTGWFTTALAPDELLAEIRLPPLPAGTGTGFIEVAPRHGDFAIVGVAAAISVDGGFVVQARVAVAGVAGAPVRIRDAEAAVAGAPATAETFGELAGRISAELDPQSDLHATAAYRRQVARVVIERALTRAAERAG
jgi:carbon-monoxide dehydrogenase medium subunit